VGDFPARRRYNQEAIGVFKQSGFGRELGKVGLEQYTEIKSVHMRGVT
jgi:acyl-CoA reductase-like NAD-dependent aldehyde dehydrogenase